MRRRIFDSEESKKLLRTFVQTQEGPKSQDQSVIRSSNGLSVASHFYKEVFGQSSLDFRGSPLGASVHHDHKMQNAFWKHRQMIFCDGDGVHWRGLTSCLDVIWHELTHRVISSSCKLIYNDPVLGKDPQGDHITKLSTKEGNHRGVLINSDIPNRAFYTVATAMAGYSWKKVGPFWYNVMTQSGLQPSATFQDFSNVLMKAAKSFGSSKLQRAMKQACADVGIDV